MIQATDLSEALPVGQSGPCHIYVLAAKICRIVVWNKLDCLVAHKNKGGDWVNKTKIHVISHASRQ